MNMTVFLLDLDGTIQGDVSQQILEYSLLQKFNTKQKKSQLKRDYQNGLLRPHFEEFIKVIKTKFENIKFFIYTASEKTWAHHIIPIIESIIEFKFERPLFTREHCILDESHKHKFVKSIAHIKPLILKSLKRSMKINSNILLDKRIFLIDNNHVLKEKQFLIKCPDYNTSVFIDIFRNINSQSIDKNYKAISKLLFNKECSNVFELRSLLYTKIAQTISKTNSKSTDIYWQQVSTIFKKYKDDISHIVFYLRKLV